MRINRKALTQRISPKGQLKLDNNLELQEFARQHPNKVCIVRVELLPVAPSLKSFHYYWVYICPEVQRALYEKGERKSLEQVDRWIREQCPITQDQKWDGEKLRKRVKELDEISTEEFNEMIEWLKEYAAENLDVYIEEPRFL